MARGIEGNEIATPRVAPKKTGGSTQKSGAKQQSIAGFFKRTPGPAPSSLAAHGKVPSFNTALKQQESNDNVTPVPSSLPAQSSSPHAALDSSQPGPVNTGRNKENGKIRSRLIIGIVADVLNRDSRYHAVKPVTQS
jgi:DNA mismatch repair protein MSH6